MLLSLRDRGVKGAKLAAGDGALGFWTALAEVYPETRMQRCWVHKTANVLDKLPKRLQAGAKSMLHEIWQAETPSRAGRPSGHADRPPVPMSGACAAILDPEAPSSAGSVLGKTPHTSL